MPSYQEAPSQIPSEFCPFLKDKHLVSTAENTIHNIHITFLPSCSALNPREDPVESPALLVFLSSLSLSLTARKGQSHVLYNQCRKNKKAAPF